VSVSEFERIEGPLDVADVAGECFVALEELELPADAAIAVVVVDAGVVGMDEDDAVTVATTPRV
jgi:hypothetical protein